MKISILIIIVTAVIVVGVWYFVSTEDSGYSPGGAVERVCRNTCWTEYDKQKLVNDDVNLLSKQYESCFRSCVNGASGR